MKNNPINKTKHHQGDISWCDCNCHTEGTPQLECKKCYVTHEPTPLTKEQEKQLIGKNVHSVYTLCFECHSWGVNLPLNHQCGNCNSNDTVTYYDTETVSQAILKERNRVVEIVENEIGRQNGLRAGCPYCGNDLCDCESGEKTAIRIRQNIKALENNER